MSRNGKFKHDNLKTSLEQMESCGFECEAGPLENNTGFSFIKEAAKTSPDYYIGQRVLYLMKTQSPIGVREEWIDAVITGARMTMGEYDYTFVYGLVHKLPHQGIDSDFTNVGRGSIKPRPKN